MIHKKNNYIAEVLPQKRVMGLMSSSQGNLKSQGNEIPEHIEGQQGLTAQALQE